MKKSDLKSGMVIEVTAGRRGLVLLDTEKGDIIAGCGSYSNEYYSLDTVNSDLTMSITDQTIDKVYSPATNMRAGDIRDELLNLIWEREDEIKLEVGKCYEVDDNDGDKQLVKVQSIEGHCAVCSGFDYHGEFNKSFSIVIESSFCNREWKPATDDAIKEAFIKEAKRKYAIGDVIGKDFDFYYGESNTMVIRDFDSLEYDKMLGRLHVKSDNNRWILLFNNGEWADAYRLVKK